EIVPITVTMQTTDKVTGATSTKEVTVDRDECNRPDTTLDGLAKLPPAFKEGGTVTAGNASQLSDGASVALLMSAERVKALGVRPLGVFRGFTVAACEPDEMGIGPVLAVPKLLRQVGVALKDIDLVELNEAFASQAVYCRDRLGIDPERLNPNGGAISIGHPYGMSGARRAHHDVRRRRDGGRRARRGHELAPMPSARPRWPLHELPAPPGPIRLEDVAAHHHAMDLVRSVDQPHGACREVHRRQRRLV